MQPDARNNPRRTPLPGRKIAFSRTGATIASSGNAEQVICAMRNPRSGARFVALQILGGSPGYRCGLRLAAHPDPQSRLAARFVQSIPSWALRFANTKDKVFLLRAACARE